MLALLAIAFIAVPLVELYVLIQVGQVIGFLPTIIVLLTVSIGGAVLVRREGARTWRAFRAATAAGRVPSREVADGALVIVGGALLLTPGFVTDIAGLLFILPPTRAVVRRVVLGTFARRLFGGGVPGAVLGTVLAARGRRRRRSSTPPAGSGRPPSPVPPPGPPGINRVIEGETSPRAEPPV